MTMSLRRFAAVSLLLLTVHAAHALTPQEQANKELVLKFYETAINQKDADAAVALLGPVYIQHNPRAPDGPEGLRGLIRYLKGSFPELRATVKRVVVEGDLVVLHVHSQPTPAAPGSAIVDIFRVENGKVVEHWDVMQPVPEKSANSTMF